MVESVILLAIVIAVRMVHRAIAWRMAAVVRYASGRTVIFCSLPSESR
jgi:hypothetical protein